MTPTEIGWKERVRGLKRDIYALMLAYRDPRVPWYARLFLLCLLAYAFSPLDLIPDFLPLIGLVDDMILLPLGILLAIKLIPPPVFQESRARAQEIIDQGKPRSWGGALVIVLIWFAGAGVIVFLFIRWWR